MESTFQFSKDTLIRPGTCSFRNLFNNLENEINICVHDKYKTLNGLSYVTAHIGNYEFNKITPKLIGSKQFFETSYITDKHFTTGLNCIDIDWDGLQLDGKTINYTTDLIDYIHDLKMENNQLKQKVLSEPTKDCIVWNYNAIDENEQYDKKDLNKVDSIMWNVVANAKYISDNWHKPYIKDVHINKDGTKMKATQAWAPVIFTNKSNIKAHSLNKYQTISTYAHPIEIYYVKNNKTGKIEKMSRRQYEYLTKYPFEYTTGVLSQASSTTTYISSARTQYSDTVNMPAMSKTTIAENKNTYTLLTNYIDITKTQLHDSYMHHITSQIKSENYSYNILYDVKTLNGDSIKMTRNEYNNLFANEINNYKLQFTYTLDNVHKGEYIDEVSGITYPETLTEEEYNKFSYNKNYYSVPCKYFYTPEIDETWFMQMTEDEFNSKSDSFKSKYVKYPIFDKDYPYNKYGYYTNDCVYNIDIFVDDLVSMERLSDILLTLSIAYYYTGEERYFDNFIEQLDLFFIDSETRMEPNLIYSQMHPGYAYSLEHSQYYDSNPESNMYFGKAFENEKLIGQAGGLIDTQHLVDAIEAVKYMNNIKDIGLERYIKIQDWFADMAKFMFEHPNGEREADTHHNNHNTNYWMTLYLFSKFANIYESSRQLFIDKFIEEVNMQIDENGEMPMEKMRQNGIAYFVMNLRIILQMCQMIGKEYIRLKMPRLEKSFEVLNSMLPFTPQSIAAKGYTQNDNLTMHNMQAQILINQYNKLTGSKKFPYYDVSLLQKSGYRQWITK